jgi:hypothetical protein
MTYKIDNNTKIVTYNNEEFYPKLVNGILIELTEQECIVEKNRREEAKLETTEYESTQYQRDRAKEYPDFKEYLDGIVKGDQAQIDKYIADCLAVKAKYPKE